MMCYYLNVQFQDQKVNKERSFTHHNIPTRIHITLNGLIEESKLVYKIINIFNNKRCCADSKLQSFISYVKISTLTTHSP